jgi:hypothetical protein
MRFAFAATEGEGHERHQHPHLPGRRGRELKAGTDDPDDSEQITEDDRNFFNAARLFLAELRRQAQERGKGDWSTTHLLAAFEQSLTLDQDLDEDLRAACCVIREWLTLEQAAVASMN